MPHPRLRPTKIYVFLPIKGSQDNARFNGNAKSLQKVSLLFSFFIYRIGDFTSHILNSETYDPSCK